MVMKKMRIACDEVVSTGAIDDLGTLGDVTYRVPRMPLPTNYEKVEVKMVKGKPTYVVHFDDGKIKEDSDVGLTTLPIV